jgi:hypothetical protein
MQYRNHLSCFIIGISRNQDPSEMFFPFFSTNFKSHVSDLTELGSPSKIDFQLSNAFRRTQNDLSKQLFIIFSSNVSLFFLTRHVFSHN